ncbi:hypothetical protein AA309_13065 [Microvirga vignae]|uniref:Uncharacterized protein n=1 Tax=Microvirga vignae TaxID=1225564 RepID=A0A0H1RC40_9HYPH|nr:hypothetical protein AA309_13065 [Microvirga vignae]
MLHSCHAPACQIFSRIPCSFPWRRTGGDNLTAVEYEAVCLIAYEGRDAYARARQQAFYCRARGSEQGFRFWSDVAAEVDRRAGACAGRAKERPR